MPSISFDRAADQYDATRGYAQGVADAIGEALFAAAGAQAGSRFLEIGIGTGRIALPLLAQGADVTGVDISPRMVERLYANLAAQRAAWPDLPWGTLDVRIADITALPFDAATFDAVVAVHVLHLVSGWQQALDEALRVLRPGGTLLIGNDRHPGTAYADIRRQWDTIVRDLGASVAPPGAPGYNALLDELRSRGLAVHESIPVTWTQQRTPRATIHAIAQRVWSGTWAIPDEPFAVSIQRLQAWADQQYGSALDTPREERAEFVVARIVKPAEQPG